MDYSIVSHDISPFGGLKTIVTENATSLPEGKPRTEDMRLMVEHMAELGLIVRKPACYSMKDTQGRDLLVIHPELQRKLAVHMRDRIDRQFMDLITGEPV